MVAITNKKRIRNNKGISLIDIMIAIAVLAILITPIILQVVTTIDTSAKAKEKQYVVDSATSVMEYFKQSSITDIKSGRNVEGLVEISSPSTDISQGVETCKIFVNGSDTGATVEYNYTDYDLASVNLGRAKKQYDRAVVMTDLANKLLAGNTSNKKRYRINYEVDADKTSSTYTNISNNSSFEILSDHSAVTFDDANSLNRHIKAIDCIEVTDSDYVDPNSISLGNIQDLDADKIAIIEGEATKLDHRFESDLVSKILDYASRHANVIDEDIMNDTHTLNTYITSLIRSPQNTFSRMIIISVTRRESAGTTTSYYYHVDVKLRYYLKFKNTSFKVFNGSNEGDITYEVMNRDFFVSEPPDVYMVYEPFITNSNSSDAEYAYNDYIVIQSDPYTSGYEDGYDPSKIYLVKPEESWQSVTGAQNGLAALQTSNPAAYEKKKNMYLTLDLSGGYSPVNINVTQLNAKVNTGDGSFVTYNQDECLPLQVVTNISEYYDTTYKLNWVHNGIADPYGNSPIDVSGTADVQFTRDYDSSAMPAIKSEEGTRLPYAKNIKYLEAGRDDLKIKKDFYDGNPYSIVPWQDESKLDGKVYNITVTYKDPKGDTTYLTGAKGAD